MKVNGLKQAHLDMEPGQDDGLQFPEYCPSFFKNPQFDQFGALNFMPIEHAPNQFQFYGRVGAQELFYNHLQIKSHKIFGPLIICRSFEFFSLFFNFSIKLLHSSTILFCTYNQIQNNLSHILPFMKNHQFSSYFNSSSQNQTYSRPASYTDPSTTRTYEYSYLELEFPSSNYPKYKNSPLVSPHLLKTKLKSPKSISNPGSPEKIYKKEKIRQTLDAPPRIHANLSTQYTERIKKSNSERGGRSQKIKEGLQKYGSIGLEKPNEQDLLREMIVKKGIDLQVRQLKSKKKEKNYFETGKRKNQDIKLGTKYQVSNPETIITSPTNFPSKNSKTSETLTYDYSYYATLLGDKYSKALGFPQRKDPKIDFLTPKPDQALEHSKSKRIYSPQFQPSPFYSPACHQNKRSSSKVSIKDFLLFKKIGVGKFGNVFLAIHLKTQFIYAVKKIPKSILLENMMVNQFILEVKIQSFLNNQNIVQLYCIFDDKQYLYLVQEFLPDGTLLNRLKKDKKIPEIEVANKISQISRAIQCMHKEGVIHRDIKPQNIVLFGSVCKLCDFGWASTCRNNERRHTFCGTFDYTAPEIFQGSEYDLSVDMWCLGILTYQLLVGSPPFYHVSRKETLQRIKNVQRKRINYPLDISQRAIYFIECLLRKNPQNRKSHLQILSLPFLAQCKDQSYY